MKFGIEFANAGPFASPDLLAILARKSEEVGIESLWTVEHVVVPVGYESTYPYSRRGRMPGGEQVPIPDPLLPLAYAAALTERIRLATGVLILPQRHPAYVAKEIATLDVLSNGRAILGVGIGWMEEEFDAVGVPFAERAARTEESLRAIQSLWSPKAEPFEGKFYRWPAVESVPPPVQRPRVPIVIGGHVKAAARRAARLGDGFFPGRSGPDELPGLLEALGDECDAIGRDPAEVEITVVARRITPDVVKRHEDLGVSRLVMPPPAADPERLRDGLDAFADEVLAKLRA
jgi:probable F420-dependent oxidoreductase